jgi:chromosome segregation ATPase
MAITPEQIYAVADELVEEGKKPTLSNVRKIIGSGSFTTISDAMTEWRENQKEILQPIRETPPDAISSRVNSLSSEIWTIAVKMANSRLNSEREALNNDRTELEATRREAVELADEMSNELDALKVLYDKAIAEGREATEQLVAQQEKTLTLSKHLEAAEIKLNANQARLDDLKTELQHAHEDTKSQREQLAEANKLAGDSREAAARLAGELEALKAQYAHLMQ